ncbi:M28 family metallopeptidase [Aquihabitans daechungensis]|uniref:M28 family metallopeptidase n=1 Tax=Aquihabitans daechungensis TaxID=1052257 RepID=UPI003B9FEF14
MGKRALGIVVVAVAALLGQAVGAAPAGPADERFDDITGPMKDFVVRPDAFGIDASRTLVDVPPRLDAVDQDRAMDVLTSLAFPRTATGPESARQDARDIVTAELEDAGYEVQSQSVDLDGVDSPNLYAELPGTECAERTIVIGAHYDSAHATGPAADDNASGVAGTMELARALADHPLPVTVRFASWSYEEVGLVGSFAMAREMAAEDREVVGAISLEMIGFTKPDIDPLTGLPSTYLGMISDPTSAPLARAFAAAAYTYTPEFPAFGAVIDPNVLPDILRSDHAAFLASGYPALMATDTANFRNPNYHTPSDTVSTIDPDFLGSSTRAALAGLITLASIDQDQDGQADACTRDLTPTTTTAPPAATSTVPPGETEPVGATPVSGAASYTG